MAVATCKLVRIVRRKDERMKDGGDRDKKPAQKTLKGILLAKNARHTRLVKNTRKEKSKRDVSQDGGKCKEKVAKVGKRRKKSRCIRWVNRSQKRSGTMQTTE